MTAEFKVSAVFLMVLPADSSLIILAFKLAIENHTGRRLRTALGCRNPTKLAALLECCDCRSLDLRVGEPVTYVQASRLKVTGPCFVGFELPDFRLRVVCGGAPQTLPSGLAMSTSNDSRDVQDRHVQALVLSWVQSLVKDSDEISVTLAHDETFSTVLVKGSDEAISILVGVKGQMARALRTLLAGTSAKLGRRYALDLSPQMKA